MRRTHDLVDRNLRVHLLDGLDGDHFGEIHAVFLDFCTTIGVRQCLFVDVPLLTQKPLEIFLGIFVYVFQQLRILTCTKCTRRTPGRN